MESCRTVGKTQPSFDYQHVLHGIFVVSIVSLKYSNDAFTYINHVVYQNAQDRTGEKNEFFLICRVLSTFYTKSNSVNF